MSDWYCVEEFEPGEVYVDADGEFMLEYAGVVTAKAALVLAPSVDVIDAEDTELVLLFLMTDSDGVGFYTHTRSDADRGYSFIQLQDSRSSTSLSGAADHADQFTGSPA